MAIVATHEGLRYLLGLMLRDEVPSTLLFKMRLFQNDYTPLLASTLADFTECTFSSYAAKNLDRSSWTVPFDLGVGAASTYGSDFQTWLTSGGTQTVYGWWMGDEGNTLAILAERFPTPIVVSTSVPVAVLPLIRIRGE